MIRAALASCLAALMLAAAPAWADDLPPSAFVHADGKRFVGPDGQTFSIRGISLGNWLVQEGYMFKFEKALSPKEIQAVISHLIGPEDAARFWDRFHDNYVAEADIRFLKAAGFNTVRVPLHYGLFVDPKDPHHFAGPGYALLDRLIGWCHAAGMKVIIDMHAAPGGQTGVNHDDGTGFPLVFYVPAYRRLTEDLWQHLAERYKNETAVLGYDLLNEPISPYNDEDTLNPRLEPLYRDIVTAIRKVDQNHVVFLAAAQWSTNFSVFGRPFAPNMAYTYHKFWANPERDAVQEYVNFSNLYNVPLFLGETGELTDEWNTSFRKLNERFGISWSFWSYKNMASDSTVVSIPEPAGWSAIKLIGDHEPEDWPSLPTPSKAEAMATLNAYLEAMKLQNSHINRSYIESLGLKAP